MGVGRVPRSTRHRLVHIAIAWLAGVLIGVPALILIVRLAIYLASGH
jgi:hypothetical protein